MIEDNRFTEQDEKEQLNAAPLLLAVFLISICAIIYELIIGATSSYLLGNSIKQYSITIGLFMSAMGAGSYLTRHFHRKLFDLFIMIELFIGLFGGLSAVLLFSSYGFTKVYHLVMYLIIIIIGILVGSEIPIITRIIEENKNNLRLTLANVLSFDYIGALLGSLAFPLILLPHLGQIRTAFLVGFLNIVVASLIIHKYKGYIQQIDLLKFLAGIFALLIGVGFFLGDQIGETIEDSFYRDKVIYSQQTPYQKIVLTKHRDDLRMFLDGNIQFSTMDEYRYHEALIHPAMTLAKEPKKVLIMGGGDGLAAREILKYEQVEKITLVDLDAAVVSLCRSNPLITEVNQHSLDHKKLEVVNQDAYKYLENSQQAYDVIIVDLPDPNNESLNKLYTNLFYRLIYRHLNNDGLAAIQSTSPLDANEAYWCIRNTVKSEGFYTSGYHLNVPSFGDWGFTLAAKKELLIDDIHIAVPTRYLNDETVKAMFRFGKDEETAKNTAEVNSLTNPVLLQYYEKAWSNQ